MYWEISIRSCGETSEYSRKEIVPDDYNAVQGVAKALHDMMQRMFANDSRRQIVRELNRLEGRLSK